MKKDFIPYEQALALKELGFDEPFNPFDTFYYRNGDLCEANKDAVEYFNSFNDEVVLAPLYQQAFRWFREKHKLYHTINMFGDWDKPQYSYLVSGRTMNNPAHMWYFEDKDSHEEAELACLIKLIEIVKN